MSNMLRVDLSVEAAGALFNTMESLITSHLTGQPDDALDLLDKDLFLAVRRLGRVLAPHQFEEFGYSSPDGLLALRREEADQREKARELAIAARDKSREILYG